MYISRRGLGRVISESEQQRYKAFLERAQELIGNGSWKDRRQRFHSDWKAYKNACPRDLDALDEEFYATDSGDPESGGGDEDLYKKKINYIRQNVTDICRSQ